MAEQHLNLDRHEPTVQAIARSPLASWLSRVLEIHYTRAMFEDASDVMAKVGMLAALLSQHKARQGMDGRFYCMRCETGAYPLPWPLRDDQSVPFPCLDWKIIAAAHSNEPGWNPAWAPVR